MSEARIPEPALRPISPSPANVRRSADEDRAWTRLYTTIRQPSTAEEVVKHLNADPASKRSHLALYIQACTTLRELKIVSARNQRIGAFVRRSVTVLVFGPFRMLRRIWKAGQDIAVEALPPVTREPAVVRTRVLRNDPAFAPAKQRFTAEPVGPTDEGEETVSRPAQAA